MKTIPTSAAISAARAKELETMVNTAVAEFVAKANRLWPSLNYTTPAVQYDLRGRVAGYAYYGKDLVKFNPVLLHENMEDFKVDTIPHELAHLISYKLYGRSGTGHGSNWKYVMQRLSGLEAKRCHNMDTTNAQVRKRATIPGYCQRCGIVSMFSPKTAAKMGMYTSRCCKFPFYKTPPQSREAIVKFVHENYKTKGLSFNRTAVDLMLHFNYNNLYQARNILTTLLFVETQP